MPTTLSSVDRAEQRSLWRWFPWLLWGALGFVVAVNFYMAYLALHTFPGIASDDVFDRSNAYDKVLAAAEHQAALGWTMTVATEAARPTITLKDRTGAPIEGARITVVAQRPLGAEDTAKLTFHATTPGHYTADTALALPGQWELLISAAAEHQTWRAAQRIVVP